jgi:hypothetical protein
LTARIDRTRWYTLRETGDLLGLTTPAVRNRTLAKTKRPLRSREVDGTIFVDASQVEAERAELLRTLRARDARDAGDDRGEDAQGHDVAALRAEVHRLNGAIAGLLVAGRGYETQLAGQQETAAGYLDAIRNLTLSSNPALNEKQ